MQTKVGFVDTTLVTKIDIRVGKFGKIDKDVAKLTESEKSVDTMKLDWPSLD